MKYAIGNHIALKQIS